jgi:hypothetical protein
MTPGGTPGPAAARIRATPCATAPRGGRLGRSDGLRRDAKAATIAAPEPASMSATLVFSAVAALFGALLAYGLHRRRRERFIDGYAFPPGIRGRVRKRYPHLSEADLDLVLDALREYFHLCRKAGRRMLAMPSQVVDAAWHEFILFTRNYQHFCRRGLGRFLHHTPAEAMRSPTEAGDGIRRTWRLACLRGGIDPAKAGALPLLFAIDGRLRIDDGFRYEPDCTQALAAAQSAAVYCGTHIGCGGGCGGGCAGSGCSGDGGCGGD